MTKTEAMSGQTLKDIYRKALLIQLFDERMRSLISTGRMAAVYYSPRGQEIFAAAMGVNLKPTDYLVTTYRGVHDQLAKGMPLRAVGRGVLRQGDRQRARARAAPMHITYPAAGIMVTTGVVGSGLPIANGLALASQLQGRRARDGVQLRRRRFQHRRLPRVAEHGVAVEAAGDFPLPEQRFAECTRYEDGTTVGARRGACGLLRYARRHRRR